jgi:hypothetical protein
VYQRLRHSRDDGRCSASFDLSSVRRNKLGENFEGGNIRAMYARAAAGGRAQAGGAPVAYGWVAGSPRWGPHPASDVRNGNGGRLDDRVRRRRCRTAQATFDYLLAPPPRIPIMPVRRCSSVSPIIVGAVCAVVVADPFREYVRTPLGFDHTPSPTRTVYSGLYR